MANDAKEKVVTEFVKLIDSYSIVGVVDMENLPARQLQNMRATLRKKGIVLRMTKGRLIFKAFEQSKKAGIEKLKEHFKGMPALIFTNENPFALFKLLKKSQSKAPIKGGQTAPDDIIVPAGPTSFAPGPVIGELGSVGIKTGVENGKIAIKQDSKVASAGDVVSAKLAGLLTRLGIEPMRIGLNISALLEDGSILLRDVLDIDEDAFTARIVQAHSDAFTLSLELAIPTKDTIELLLQRAFMNATTLALDRKIVNGETLAPLLSEAYAGALALSGLLPEEAKESAAPKAEEKTEAAPEEKKEEAPASEESGSPEKTAEKSVDSDEAKSQ